MRDGRIVTDSNFNSSPNLIASYSNYSISKPKFPFLRKSTNNSTASFDNYCNYVKNKYEINSENLKKALQNRRIIRAKARENLTIRIEEAKKEYTPCANSYEDKFKVVF